MHEASIAASVAGEARHEDHPYMPQVPVTKVPRHARVHHSRSVLEQHHDPIPAFTARIAGFIGNRASAGTFEVWTCAQCGLTEWYAKGLESLDLSKMEGQVQFFDASAPAGGGYR